MAGKREVEAVMNGIGARVQRHEKASLYIDFYNVHV